MPSSPKTIKALKASGHLQICFALAALIYLVVLIIIRLEFSTAIILNLICVAFAIINTVFTAVVTRKQLGHAGNEFKASIIVGCVNLAKVTAFVLLLIFSPRLMNHGQWEIGYVFLYIVFFLTCFLINIGGLAQGILIRNVCQKIMQGEKGYANPGFEMVDTAIDTAAPPTPMFMYPPQQVVYPVDGTQVIYAQSNVLPGQVTPGFFTPQQ